VFTKKFGLKSKSCAWVFTMTKLRHLGSPRYAKIDLFWCYFTPTIATPIFYG